jgi:lipoyl(octanoyl) transferase
MQIRDLGLQSYEPILKKMQDFTLSRDEDTADELWLVEHEPVFTQGANGDRHHVLNLHDIPLVDTDRGGQVTYHGPGQLVAYPLVDLCRFGLMVRQMVSVLENSVICFLAGFDIASHARQDAPGVYVNEAKIASLGLRVKRGACYHGVSLNIDMDLTPFTYINPCGQPGMEVIDLKSLGITLSMPEAKQLLTAAIEQTLQQGKQA